MTEDQMKYYLNRCLEVSKQSRDPSTQVGSVIVHENLLTTEGHNRFPKGIANLGSRWMDRDEKLKLVVHAEIEAIMLSSRKGRYTEGATLFVAARDTQSGIVWGGSPCIRCTVELIQAGIETVVGFEKNDDIPARWRPNLIEAEALLEEAGIRYIEVPFASNN